MTLLAIALSLTLTADAKAKPKDAGSGDSTMKNLMKDAVTTTPTAGTTDGGTVHNDADGPDVSKMVFGKDAIAKVVAFHQPKIQSCYEETLASKDKAIEGTLVTSWLITPEGMVKGAKIEKKGTTLKESKLHDCVISVISAMNFPAPPDKKNQPITYPFNLKALH